MKNIPLYKYPFSYAAENGELAEYRLSNTTNSRCRDAIEVAIRNNYRNNCLDMAGVEKVLADFGAERTRYVLANTVHHADWDQRYSRSNKEWAEGIVKRVHVEKTHGSDPTLLFRISSHPCLVDGFIHQVRQLTEGV